MRSIGQQKAVVFSGAFDGLEFIISVRGPAERLDEITALAASLAETAEVAGMAKESLRAAVAA